MRIFRNSLVEILNAAAEAVFGSLVPEEEAARVRLIRFGIFRRSPRQMSALISGQLQFQSLRDLLRNGVLHGEDAGKFLVESIRPQRLTVLYVYQLHRDADPIAHSLHRAFKHRVNAQFTAYLGGIV